MPARGQALGDGVPPAGMTLLASTAPDLSRRAPQPAQDAPHQHRRHNGLADRQREYRQRSFYSPAVPRQNDVAGLIGNPSRTQSRGRNQQQEQNASVHQIPMALV